MCPLPKKWQSYKSLMTIKHSLDWVIFVENYRHPLNFNPIFTSAYTHIDVVSVKKIAVTLWPIKEKAMALHSSTLAWIIPWMEEPGRLQSMGSLGVRHDWVTSLSLFTFLHWRRKWQLTPVLLPGESQEQGSLVGCHLWGHTESDMTEVT